MATIQNLYNNIKTLITKYFEEKTIEDETLPELIESYFNYNQGKLNIGMPHMKLTVTGSSFETYSSTPFTYTRTIFVDWGDNTGLIEHTNGKLSHSFTDGLYSHTVKVYSDLTVLRISCFKDCTGLTSITLPDSVTTLREDCFAECTNLTSITIPDSVITLETGCFKHCTSLTSITIPSSVTSLGHNCFNGCTGLTSISIPNSVTSLGIGCFYNCTGLTSANIPSSITSLELHCFEGCTGLTDYLLNWTSSSTIIAYDSNKMPNNTNTIFHIPTGTKQLYIDKGYPSDKLMESSMELTVTGSSFSTFNSTPFTYNGRIFVDWGDNSGLVEYTGGKLTHSFTDELNSHTVKIYGDVTSLGSYCFYNCTGLTSVIIPNSVTSLAGSCFGICTGLTSVLISSGVTSLANGCFYNCTGLTSVIIPDSVTSLGIGCFANCTGLIEIVLLWDSSSEIGVYGDSLIQGCASFNHFLIPNGTTSLYTAKSYPSDKLVESD